jgi:hypothetical protein
MQKPVGTRKLRMGIARIVLCLLGVIFLLIGIGAGRNGDVSLPMMIYAGCGVVMGLVQLFLGVFGSDTAVVRFLASLMESE